MNFDRTAQDDLPTDASGSLKVTPLTAVLPEVALLRASKGADRKRLVLILAATAAFMAVVGVGVLLLLAKEEKTARHAATTFAAALVHNEPSSAPDGAADYVRGVREYFGPVTSAKVIAAHNKGVNTGDSADTRSFFVVELLLGARRGPAVIEVAFDNHALNSERVSDVYELEPSDAPALTPVARRQLAAAFARRGGKRADQATLSVAEAPAPAPVTPAVPSAPAAPKARAISEASPAAKHLRCVQRAHGDIAKLQKCAES